MSLLHVGGWVRFYKGNKVPWDYKDNTFEHYMLSEFHNNYFPIYKITNKHILEVIKLTNRNTEKDAYQETYLKEVNERIRVWK